jgi:hypothetical protein
MNVGNASPLAEPLPLAGAGTPENVERFPWGRVDVGQLWASIKWAASVMKWLTISMVFFLTGFTLGITTVLLTLLRFAGADVSVESLITCASGALVALWASGGCSERAREEACQPTMSRPESERVKLAEGGLTVQCPVANQTEVVREALAV